MRNPEGLLPPNHGGLIGASLPYVSSAAGEVTDAEFDALEGRVTVNENDISSFEGIGKIIRYFGLDKPAGYTPDFEALFWFDGTASELTDRSGNSHDLTLQNGTAKHIYSTEHGLVAMNFGPNLWYNSPVDAQLPVLQQVTVEAVIAWQQGVAGDQTVYGLFGTAAGEQEAENYTISLKIEQSTGQLLAFWESGLGTNREVKFDAVVPRYRPCYVALTREEDGVTCKIYVDGKLLDTGVGAAAPTGGGNNRIWIGGQSTSSDYTGDLYCCRHSIGIMTAAQIAAVNNSLRVLQ